MTRLSHEWEKLSKEKSGLFGRPNSCHFMYFILEKKNCLWSGLSNRVLIYPDDFMMFRNQKCRKCITSDFVGLDSFGACLFKTSGIGYFYLAFSSSFPGKEVKNGKQVKRKSDS